MLDIKQYLLNDNQYYFDNIRKNKIILHHTAGGGRAESVIDYWNMSKERIATQYVISRSGEIFRCMIDDRFWAWHLGLEDVTTEFNTYFNSTSIGIELCAYGFLEKRGNEYFNVYNTKVKNEDVCVLDKNFKGHYYYQKYTDEQIASLEKLIEHLLIKHDIQMKNTCFDIHDFFYSDSFKRDDRTIYTHSNIRKDKTDVFPQPSLIEMINDLIKKRSII